MCEECKEWTLKRVLDCLFLGVSKGVKVFFLKKNARKDGLAFHFSSSLRFARQVEIIVSAKKEKF